MDNQKEGWTHRFKNEQEFLKFLKWQQKEQTTPVKEERQVKEDIANIIRDNIYFSGQLGDYVIHGAIEKIIEYFTTLPNKSNEAGEWQLCPKCNGDGHLGRYNPPMFVSTSVTPICDVCYGAKIIAKPIVIKNKSNEAIEFADWKDDYLNSPDLPIGELPSNAELYNLFSPNEQGERK